MAIYNGGLNIIAPDISGKEDKSNKVTAWSSTTTDAHYPSEKLVKSALDTKVNTTDVLTFEKIQAATDLSGKVASADTIKNIGIDKTFIFLKPITDDSNLIIIGAGPDTYQGYPKFVSAMFVAPFLNADIGGYVWYQSGDEEKIFLRHSKPSRDFGDPSVLVMVIV